MVAKSNTTQHSNLLDNLKLDQLVFIRGLEDEVPNHLKAQRGKKVRIKTIKILVLGAEETIME